MKNKRRDLEKHHIVCPACGGEFKITCGAIVNLMRMAHWIKTCPVPSIFKKVFDDPDNSKQ